MKHLTGLVRSRYKRNIILQHCARLQTIGLRVSGVNFKILKLLFGAAKRCGLCDSAIKWKFPRTETLLFSGPRARTHSHNKICCWRCAHVFDSMLIIGAHEPDRARSEAVARAIDGEFHRSFPNEPHFGVHVMVRRVRRAAGLQRRFVDLQRFTGRELAFQDVADLRIVGRSNRQLFERIHRRRQGAVLRSRALDSNVGGEKCCGEQRTNFTPGHGHWLLLLLPLVNESFREFEPEVLRSSSTSEQRIFSMPSFVKDASLRSIFEMQAVRQMSQQTRAVETGKNRELSDPRAPNSPRQSEMSREAVQVTATAFIVLFCIVGMALWGLPFYYDFMVQQFGWTRGQVTSGNALSKLVVGPIFGFNAGGNFDGRHGAGWTRKHLDARHVLFFLHAERVGICLRRAAAKPSDIVALVRTISRE